MNPLAALSGGVSTSVASRSGDASAGLNASLQYQGAFQVGGKGNSQSAAASQDASQGTPTQNNILLYVAIGIGALALVTAVAIRR